jgi:hypothetical protein
MARKGKAKWRVGDVVAIPLSDGRCAFARLFKEGDYEIYNLLTAGAMPSLETAIASGIAFCQSGTNDPVNSGAWPIIGNHPFANEEAAWMPAQATGYDRASGTWFSAKPEVMVRGNARRATAKEVRGMDVWMYCADAEAMVDIIEDRLVRGNHSKYKVREE